MNYKRPQTTKNKMWKIICEQNEMSNEEIDPIRKSQPTFKLKSTVKGLKNEVISTANLVRWKNGSVNSKAGHMKLSILRDKKEK